MAKLGVRILTVFGYCIKELTEELGAANIALHCTNITAEVHVLGWIWDIFCIGKVEAKGILYLQF